MESIDLFGGEHGLDKEAAKDDDTSLRQDEREMINLTNKIRRIALNPKTKLDQSQHTNPANLDLFKFIASCGIEVETFVKEYLAQIHPFMLSKYVERSENTFMCLLDTSYAIPLWVEIETKQFSECIISFHEAEWKDRRIQSIKEPNTILLKAVEIQTADVGTTMSFKAEVLCGLETISLQLFGTYVGDNYFRIPYSEYENALLALCNTRMSSLFKTQLVQLNRLNKFRFTSWGTNLQNKLSFILDCVAANGNILPELSFVLAVVLREIQKLSDGQAVIDILLDKYSTYQQLDIHALLMGVRKNLVEDVEHEKD